jgi:O-antigen/teichoic acid export membrane protein
VSTLLVTPFTAIWSVVIYEIAVMPDAKKLFSDMFRHFFNAVCLALFGLTLFAQPILSVLAGPKFAEAIHLIPLCALAVLIQSLSIHFRTPALVAKKTGRMILPSLAGAAAAIGGNLVLVPRYGMWGAASAAIVSGIVFSVVGLYLYQRIERFEYPFSVCLRTLLAMAATFLGCVFLQSIQPGMITRLVVPGIAFCLWFAVLVRPVIPLLFGEIALPAATGSTNQ